MLRRVAAVLVVLLPMGAGAQTASDKASADLTALQDRLRRRLQEVLQGADPAAGSSAPRGADGTVQEDAGARAGQAERLRAIEESMRRAIDRVPADLRSPDAAVDAAAAADEIAAEVEGDEADDYAATMHERVVRDLVRRNPGARADDIVLIESVPPAYGDPDRFGIVFVHFEMRDGSSMSSLDALAYRDDGGGPRLAGNVDVWGASPGDVTRGRGHVEFTTVTPRDGDPRCCPSGWTRFRVSTSTLAVRVVASAE